MLPTVGFFFCFGILPEGSVSFEMVAFSVDCIVSGVAISELPPDAETPTEVEAVGDKELLFTFSPVVQAVNVPAINIMLIIIAIFFFILSPSFQQQVYPKNFKCPEIFEYQLIITSFWQTQTVN